MEEIVYIKVFFGIVLLTAGVIHKIKFQTDRVDFSYDFLD